MRIVDLGGMASMGGARNKLTVDPNREHYGISSRDGIYMEFVVYNIHDIGPWPGTLAS